MYVVPDDYKRDTKFKGFGRGKDLLARKSLKDIEIEIEGWYFHFDEINIVERGVNSKLNEIIQLSVTMFRDESGGEVRIFGPPGGDEVDLGGGRSLENNSSGLTIIGETKFSDGNYLHFNDGLNHLSRTFKRRALKRAYPNNKAHRERAINWLKKTKQW